MSNTCRGCSSVLLDGADFCTKCGIRVATALHSACPQCGSDDVRSFEMVYMNGTSQLNGSQTLGLASGSFSTTQQTNLAALTSPPQLRPALDVNNMLAIIVPSAFVALPILISFGVHNEIATHIGRTVEVIAVFVAMICLYAYFQKKKFRAAYNRAYILWKKSSICMRCGHAFYN